MRSTQQRYIDADKQAYGKLAKAFGCTEKYVYMALTYRTDAEKANKIRYAAVKEYGAVPMMHAPQAETVHIVTENGNQVMEQRFDNGSRLLIDKTSGDAWGQDRKGRHVGAWKNISVRELARIQTYMENL